MRNVQLWVAGGTYGIDDATGALNPLSHNDFFRLPVFSR